MTESDATREKVSEYYGKVLESKKDLKTSACCTAGSVPEHVRVPLKLIEDEVLDKYYGCGSPIPLVLKGKKVLDLGCGTGRDCFILSYHAGEEGEVIGVDMTDEQLEVANRYLPVQMEKFGFKKGNLRFLKGYIEDLKALGLSDNTFDVVVSNCVVNLSPDKEGVLREVFRVLKEGGEFFFSDVFADRRLPDWTKEDPVLLGECLGGALYRKDFERWARAAGFTDPRVFSSSDIALHDKDVRDKIGFAKFFSMTYRLFKVKGLEDACEDYGQTARYKGTVPFSGDIFRLDEHHAFSKGKSERVCGNTADMLCKTRFKENFEVTGDRSVHRGVFADCGCQVSRSAQAAPGQGGCC